MIKWISFIIDRVCVVAGALLFSQIPNYFVHYTQRLGGHASELKLQIDTIQQAAQKSGKTLPEFIHKFQAHADSDISLQGDIMKGMMARYMDLSSAYTSMLDATPFTKPLVFVKHFQWNVAQLTLQDFTWGFSITMESAFYAFFGMIFGFAVYKALSTLLRRSFNAVIPAKIN